MEKFIKKLQKLNKDPNFTKEEKIQIINEVFSNYRNYIDKDYKNYVAKQYAGAGLEILSAGLPVGGFGRLGAQYIGKPLTQYVGRKIAQEIGSGIVAGGTSAGVFGTGEGLMNNQNPLLTGLEAIPAGMATGGALGLGIGKVQQINKANQLNNASSNPNKFKISNKYYSDYEQGRNVIQNDLGQIKFSSGAFKETNVQSPQNFDKVIDLTKNVQNAKFISTELPIHNHKYDISKFHRLRNKDLDYIIAENTKGHKYFHKVADPDLSGPKPEEQGLPNTIIPNSEQNFNPNSSNYSLSGYISKDEYPLLHKLINKLKSAKPPANSAPEANINSSISKYANYKNSKTGNDKIYTREDIGSMSTDEYIKNEDEIMAQVKSEIGIPTEAEMEAQAKVSDSGVIYVNAYTRSDGTKVKGYYRSK